MTLPLFHPDLAVRIALRPYQQDALAAISSSWRDSPHLLAVMPTGSGKTIVFGALANQEAQAGGKTLVLAHRDELISQAVDKIARITTVHPTIEKADLHRDPSNPITVASIQTLSQNHRLYSIPKDTFSLIIADEAHHSVSDSWNRVLSYFGNAKVLGVTATADRSDKRTLSSYYGKLAYEIGMVDLIKQGYLAPIKILCLPLKIDLTPVRSVAGDFDQGDLGTALLPFLPQIARAVKEHAAERRTLAFLPLIATSQAFNAECQRVGLRSAHVDGNSPLRREILERFQNGDLDILTNAMLLTEGFDSPPCDAILILRPTRSRPLYQQMIGRGTRVHPGKKNLLILDLLWLHQRHQIIKPASLVASSPAEESDLSQAFDATASSGGDPRDLLETQGVVRAQRESALAHALRLSAARQKLLITPEEFAARHHLLAPLTDFTPVFRWESLPISAKQDAFLRRRGVDPSTLSGRGQASLLISSIIASWKH